MGEFLKLRGHDVQWVTVDGEVVALDMRSELYLGVNPAGARLWQALADGTTHAELLQILIDEYSIDRQVAGRDVDAFIEQLREQGLLSDEDG